MMLTREQSYRLLKDHGCYVIEACDKCGQLLGAVRFTRRGDADVWCSRECRGDHKQESIQRGGRPRRFETDADRQRAYRKRITVPRGEEKEEKQLQVKLLPVVGMKWVTGIDARERNKFKLIRTVTKPPCSLAETKDLREQEWPLSTTPLPGLLSPCKQPSGERGVG